MSDEDKNNEEVPVVASSVGARSAKGAMFSTDVGSAGDSSGLADSVIGSVGSGMSGVSFCDTVPEPLMAEPERKEAGFGVVDWSSVVSSCAAFAEVPASNENCLSALAATSGNAISSRERSSGSSELVVSGSFAAEGLPKRKGTDDVLSPSSTASGARLVSE